MVLHAVLQPGPHGEMGPVNLLRMGCANDMLARLEMTTVHGGTSGRAMMQAQRCQQCVYRSDAFGLMGAHDRREDHARAMLHGVPASSVLGVLPNEPPHLIDCCGFHGLDRAPHILLGSLGWMASLLMCWSGGAGVSRVHDGGGTAGQDTGHVTKAPSMPGHLEPWRCDFRQATMMAVVDEPRVRRTAGMLTAGPVFPWGGDALFPHIGVLTRRPAKLEDGHGDLRDPAGEQLSGS